MKIIRKGKKSTVTKKSQEAPSNIPQLRHVWKVLIIDDEPDIHELTKLNLKGFQFENQSLKFYHAYSAVQARSILKDQPDIAVALIDVVMETDDAGLKLVHYIREEIKYEMIRLIIRTGQPGQAPERFVIDNYDIDDYKDKTELTTQKLYTTMRSALKSYRDLQAIDMNRKGLLFILDATPEIYKYSQKSLPKFFQGILTQIVSLYNLDANAVISTLDGMVVTMNNQKVEIRAGTGDFSEQSANNKRVAEVVEACSESIMTHSKSSKLRKNSLVIPLIVEQDPVGFVYIEPIRKLDEADYNLLKLFANQCSAAMESLKLHFDLQSSYNHAIDMLAVIAEFRDSSTGNHINRIAKYTSIMAMELGFSEQEAELYGQSARLHDIGKVGIPDHVLLKKGKLTEEEFEVIKTHTDIGVEILAGSKQFTQALEVCHSHHERWDGKGYPKGLKGKEIPLIARIVSVIDVFDALISKRCYKEAWPIEDAIIELGKSSGTQFDSELIDIFLTLYHKGRFDEIILSMKN